MEWILQQISQMDIGTLIAIGGMFWLFKKHLDNKFEKIELEIKSLRSDINDIEKRIVAIETTIRIQGGCKLNYDYKSNEKVE